MPESRGWLLGRAGYLDFAFRWLTPEELEPLDYDEDADVALVHRVGEIELPRDAFSGPALAAAAGFAVGLAFAPSHMDLLDHRQQYAAFFGTTAQAVATLFVALALGVGHATIRRRFYRLTVAYVVIGSGAALVATSAGLPHWSYRFLLALALGGGAGALVSTALIAFWAVEERSDAQAPPAPR